MGIEGRFGTTAAPSVPIASFRVLGSVMRRLLPLLAAVPALACGAAASGYDLVTVSGAALPASIEVFGTMTVTSGSITLRTDSTFAFTLTFRRGDGFPETENDSGTFTLDELNVIHFAPELGSDDEEPFEGAWDGDRITVTFDDIALVFLRSSVMDIQPLLDSTGLGGDARVSLRFTLPGSEAPALPLRSPHRTLGSPTNSESRR